MMYFIRQRYLDTGGKMGSGRRFPAYKGPLGWGEGSNGHS